MTGTHPSAPDELLTTDTDEVNELEGQTDLDVELALAEAEAAATAERLKRARAERDARDAAIAAAAAAEKAAAKEAAAAAGPPQPEWLTVAQACEHLAISRSTWERLRRDPAGPPARKLPTGAIRVRRTDLDTWATGLEAA